jgi:glycosyltransferase involved in cell wall biosynthesis
MNITVIVCTYNRCETVTKALDSLAAQNIPESIKWDVLIVDNNSSDKTREVLERYCSQYPNRFSYIFEAKQGLSHARNAGIEKARGQILAFTDDDAIVEPDWLWNLTSSLESGEWAGAGGRIIPVWSGEIPDWLSRDDVLNIGTFGGFDMGPEAGALARPPYGGNVAFRREVFEKYGRYRVDLGRSANNLQGREDIELANRLFARDERLRYEPKAVIQHPVTESRMKKSYVLRWSYWEGRSEIADVGPLLAKWSILGVPIYLFRRLVRWKLQSLICLDPRQRFFCERNMWRVAGYIVACYKESQRRDGRARASAQISAE